MKLKSKKLYALVFDGKPYIATEYGYYPLEKVHNILTFTGKVKVAASEGDKNGAQMAFGLIGRAMASGGYEASYEMAIDPVSGVFVHLHKIETPEQSL
jgi:fructose-1,6-bisphosphatase/sedoheptulose 1,7-bisphosphatase-like protein